MRTFRLLLYCVLIAGCSRYGLGAVPVPSYPNAANQSGHFLAHKAGRNAVTLQPLYEFQGEPDGANPAGALFNVNGTLFGTTTKGGAQNLGTIFTVAPSGAETVLHSFGSGADGASPQADLIEVNGTLYGTTASGGESNKGTVFIVAPSGAESVLYSFKGGADGEAPEAALSYVNGVMYGTTAGGGTKYCQCGTIFTITTIGKERAIYRFKGPAFRDGASPLASVIDVGGSLYGTTADGGIRGGGNPDCGQPGCGTVFKVTPAGAETVLYRFQGKLHDDGSYPAAPLIDVGGTLYGTTVANGHCSGDIQYCGIVFKVTLAGKESVVHFFQSGPDGKNPYAGLININGTLYGTTAYGGTGTCGTIFAITPSGTETVLYSFTGGTDRGNPVSRLTAVNGTLYGTTYGGNYNTLDGSVFSLTL